VAAPAEANDSEEHDRSVGMSESANKRRVAAQRNDRKMAKNERRQQRRHEHSLEPVDQAEIMSRFHHLNEFRSRGTIAEHDFERQRHDIFVSLGLEDL
jgi:hypothetical protein